VDYYVQQVGPFGFGVEWTSCCSSVEYEIAFSLTVAVTYSDSVRGRVQRSHSLSCINVSSIIFFVNPVYSGWTCDIEYECP
jgi:hypothetical protein